jgi:hypothetical protein
MRAICRIALLLGMVAVAVSADASTRSAQWGTSPLRTTDIWWSCDDREARCGSADLTYVQMDNTRRGVLRDLCRAEASGITGWRFERKLNRLRAAVAQMEAARGAVNQARWDTPLQDYTAATIHAERVAEKLLGPLYGYDVWNGWKPNAAQLQCGVGATSVGR